MALEGRPYSPGMRIGRRAAVVVLGVAVTLTAGVRLGRPVVVRRHDVAARRSIYHAFPVFPGAVKTNEDAYELPGFDGGMSGHYGLTVTYRLPPTATSSETLGFLRRNIPNGWQEASDQTCVRKVSDSPPPPVATMPGRAPAPTAAVPPAQLVLMARRSTLTVFTPNEDGTPDGKISGLTFSLSGSGHEKHLTLDQATFACQAAPDPDPAADEFDAGGR